MDEQAVREHAQALCDALVAGDMDLVTADFSTELRHNLGEIIALLPLPSNEATIESVEQSGAGYNAVIRIAGEIDEVMLQTRWKERDDKPTIIEASHLSKVEVAPAAGEEEDTEEADAAG